LAGDAPLPAAAAISASPAAMPEHCFSLVFGIFQKCDELPKKKKKKKKKLFAVPCCTLR
jgi:hypothetical protein